MRALTGQDIVRIWEIGSGQHPVDRALTMLAAACPEIPRERLPVLSVGQRDACLLNVRKWAFGTRLASYTECLACKEQLEFALNVDDIYVAPDSESVKEVQQMSADEYELHFRLPNSLDLAAAASCSEVDTACHLLVSRCVLKATQRGEEVAVEALPEMVITALSEQIAGCDPQAEVQIDLICPSCGHRWLAMFDIVSFLWTEICVQAKRLMREVHTLAWAYGWREADILSLSAARRQMYMEMVT